MSVQRKIVFANGEYYHVYNRGFEKRAIFTDKRELARAQDLIWYYSFNATPIRYSKFKTLPQADRETIIKILKHKKVEVVSYCLMPNHFHFLLKQIVDNGITSFISHFSNSYTKYFNSRHERSSNIFQGVFKSVYVEDDEQLIHLSRYIHLNPCTSYLISKNTLSDYSWSSFQEYIGTKSPWISQLNDVLSFFKSPKEYEKFCLDQVDYARELKRIEHLLLE